MINNNNDISNDKKLFSIMVLNYNNFDYLFQMIDSIYNQSYSNIEVIIVDDFSSYFDKAKLLKYLKKKNSNIKASIYINDNNLGTVKTINKYLPKLNGDYYLITASDDVFPNKNVISNYVRSFEETNCRVVTSQWVICDENLKILRNYIPKYKINKYNNNQSDLLFEMCKSNRFGSGSTAYKKEIFDDYKFDEHYKYLEDWPFWLKLLFNKEKIYVASFEGLLHRSGGISETTNITSSTKQFFTELLETFHKEIIPNLNNFGFYRQWSIIDSYKFFTEYYKSFIDTSFYEKEFKNIVYNNNRIKRYYYLNELNPHLYRDFINIVKHNRISLVSIVFTIILSFIMSLYIENNNLKLLFIILIYLFIYTGLIVLKEVWRWLRWKNTH